MTITVKTIVIVGLILILAGVGYYFNRNKSAETPSPSNTESARQQAANQNSEKENSAKDIPALPLVPPLDRAGERVTKKPFGIYITQATSPVQPERFSGYHTGVDFETFPEEKDVDVIVRAVCAGPLLQKRTASGYGGVAVQSCTINAQAVTIIYGHLRLSSIQAAVNQKLSAGDKLGVLGTGYSGETDGERKHLHLGIHKGTAISILGYVQAKSGLSAWLDAATLGATSN